MFSTDNNDDTTNDSDNNGGIQNEGEQCWWTCGRKNGECDWCGKEGMCCRQGSRWAKQGCDGEIGGKHRHECSKIPNAATSGSHIYIFFRY